MGGSIYYDALAKKNLKRLKKRKIVQYFKKTVTRDLDGRFVLPLPTKQGYIK